MVIKAFVIGRIGGHHGGLTAEQIIDKVKNEQVSLLATFRVHYLIEGSMSFIAKHKYENALKSMPHGSFHKISITDFELIYGISSLHDIAEERALRLYPVFTDRESEHIKKALEGNEVEMAVFRMTKLKLHNLARDAGDA